MGTNESGTSHLPENIKAALAREPIILGAESIGRYFRNGAEIADVESVIAGQKTAIAVGLVGSRLSGRFSYSPKALFDKLKSYGQKHINLEDEERLMYGFSGMPPIRFQEPFNRLALYLKSALDANRNLGDINLLEFPADLQQFLTFAPYDRSMPFVFRPKGFEYKDPQAPLIQRPAAYYPDIDIAVISENPLMGSIAWLGDAIGAHSGVRIQATLICPVSGRPTEQREVIDSMMENFRPLSKPASAE